MLLIVLLLFIKVDEGVTRPPNRNPPGVRVIRRHDKPASLSEPPFGLTSLLFLASLFLIDHVVAPLNMTESLILSIRVPKPYADMNSLDDYVDMARVTNNGDMLADALADRAKALFNQGEYERAYQDAQCLIELIPFEARGYLLRGQLLQKHHGSNCWELRETYKAALANVPPDDYDYPLLTLYYHRVDGVLRRLRKDVLNLPTDVCDVIFSYISFEELAVATGVSRRWRYYVLGLPRLWHHVSIVYRRQLTHRRMLVSNLDFLSHACAEHVHNVEVKTFAMVGLTDWLLQQQWKQVTSLGKSAKMWQSR